MDASVACVVGAAIGVLGAVAGGWVSVVGQGRQQQRQLHAERAYRREDARREAYGALIASTKLLSASWWRFSDLVWDEQSTPEQWRASSAESHETWVQFSTAVAAVVVAGPVAAAEAADELRVAMYEWEMAGLDWLSAALREGHGQLAERFKEAWQAKRAPDRAFQQPARQALGTEEP
ncbi:hypothetical protein OOK27_21870 [Streptomyces canus]|uniref:hypothetical protein n=1 Tax=Streptomyces canus TaxID=58343 RepID=UPI00224F3C38|nr:hypothetical protein [Streptomyces canus]MCX5256751.1 hypothetical protein [Streptomyces canus]